MNVDLISSKSDFGRGANDGAYYPVGLLTLGSYLKNSFSQLNVSIIDTHHESYECQSDIVGISASSTLNYKNVLDIASKAKSNGSIVVLGGPHSTQLTEQIFRNRRGIVDYIIRGKGEKSFFHLIDSINRKSDLVKVPGLSWLNGKGEIVHNPISKEIWNYDNFLPLDFGLLSCGIKPYWDTFRYNIDSSYDAAFVLFTHFGCGYRESFNSSNKSLKKKSWCVYCSLNDPLSKRNTKNIVNEAMHLIHSNCLPHGSKILLKCYGDNIGTEELLLKDLAAEIENSDEWKNYNIEWTFYAQSSKVTPALIELLKRIGTRNIYIGFDSADNDIQKMNGLGTSLATHKRAVELCKSHDIKIQAGFVLGCAGETEKSLKNTLNFAEWLNDYNVLERINSAVLFVIPGSPAYNLLCEKELWIRELDLLPAEQLQESWIKHFCPNLAESTTQAMNLLTKYANYLDELSPGPHASMGYESEFLRESKQFVRQL